MNQSDDHLYATPRRFLRVLPLAFITYSLAYLDRVNYASAETRIRAALQLTGTISSFVAAVFFLGYFAFQIPGASYASRRSLKKLIFWALVLWGILSALTGVLNTVPLLIIDRLLLGAVEGVVLPAMLIFVSRWFARAERSRANAVLILANPMMMATASILSGFLISYFDRHKVGLLSGWQVMFIAEGLPSVIWAVFWMALADERPRDAKWLSKSEAEAVQQRLDAEQRTIDHVPNYWLAFSDKRVILLALTYMCFNIAGYGLMMWLPQIVEEGTKQGVGKAGLLTAIPYVLAVFSILAVSQASDRILKRKRFVVGSMFIGCAAFCVAYLAGPNHFRIAFAALVVVGSCIYTPCAPLWAWMSEILPRNVLGESMALVNSAGALGGFFGTLFVGWLKTLTGSTGPAFIFQATCFALAGTFAIVVRTRTTSIQAFGVVSLPAEPA